jgi:hypothetical protein
MPIFHVTDPSGRLVGVVRQPDGDESAVREALAGRGKDRDERYISQDGGYSTAVVDASGPAKVLWRDEGARQAGAKAEEQPAAVQAQDELAAGAKPDVVRGSR